MKRTLVLCLLLISLTGIGLSCNQINENIENPIQYEVSFEKNYQPNALTGANITIQNDQNLTDYGFPGIGTALDPFRIENYTILTVYYTGIEISNTTKHILIQNCTITAEWDGISIGRVAAGTIRINNNSIVNNDRIGIFTSYAPELIINDNYFYNSYWGINYNSSPDVQITNNTFVENHYGVRVESNSTLGIIKDNEFFKNVDGVALENAPQTQVLNNVFRDNYIGILLSSSNPEQASNYCKINNNLIENSDYYGIFITAFMEQSFTKYSVIHHNTLINNNPNGTSQALDHGTENTWYDKESREGNFWSEWWGVGAYKIAGKAGSKDKYPLSSPEHEVSVDIPVFLKGRVILYSTVIPVAVLSIVLVYLIIRRKKK